MTDLQATLDAIDEVAVQECGHCRRPLRPDGPSPDFCASLVELRSPEVTPPFEWPDTDDGYGMTFVRVGETPDSVTYRIEFDTTPIAARFVRMAEEARSMEAASAAMTSRWDLCREATMTRFSGGWAFFAALGPVGVVINSQRVTAPEPEVTPEPDEPPFGSDFDFEHTAAKSLPHEPPPAVMPRVPEPDWQALVDGAPRTGPERRRRAPRELRKPR